jgi:hypothetical protein
MSGRHWSRNRQKKLYSDYYNSFQPQQIPEPIPYDNNNDYYDPQLAHFMEDAENPLRPYSIKRKLPNNIKNILNGSVKRKYKRRMGKSKSKRRMTKKKL